MGGNYDVVHHTQYINELIIQGKIKPKNTDNNITFHDPCYLGRHNEEYDAPRAILKAASGNYIEMNRIKNNSFCCGAGGAQMWKEEEKGVEAVRKNRFNEAESTGAETIGTGCPFCMTMLTDAGSEKSSAMKVKDIAEIVADSL